MVDDDLTRRMSPPTRTDAGSSGRPWAAEVAAPGTPGLLGDTPAREYGRKLELFALFVEPEVRPVLEGLVADPGCRVLDAGCGPGVTTEWLTVAASHGTVVGVDLARGHAARARRRAVRAAIVQADLARPPFPDDSFDVVWCGNTLHHLRDPVGGARRLGRLLAPGGTLAVGQSGFLPDLFFAWDARLEREVTRACHAYYRDRYGLSECDTTGIRRLVGIVQEAGLEWVGVRTVVIERTLPLSPADEEYFLEAVFRGVWGEKLRPYLSVADYRELERLCDPGSDSFCLRRADFHHVQTFTVVTGKRSLDGGWRSKHIPSGPTA